ncbi:hypothetical protein ASG49_17355 [Marmoricola sp. Leaf446]|uniref:hypothetical protein n=1 Tax=Marmoricola sp. Leaf446 TaxID=1736379 RepID=UPI0006FC0FDB|nr:hypothetical protein [Marmoricola sp. Leaf446]KQT89504.1 hypothetical protein ASG49_17355 [Marmoricola sp. Leaf446]
MRKLLAGLFITLMIVVASATPAAAGGSGALFKNCGPGKAVVLHWHNYKYGYVDIYWVLNRSNFPGSMKYGGYFNAGNHAKNTGQSTIYHGYGATAARSIDLYWATCTSAF